MKRYATAGALVTVGLLLAGNTSSCDDSGVQVSGKVVSQKIGNPMERGGEFGFITVQSAQGEFTTLKLRRSKAKACSVGEAYPGCLP